MKTDDLKKGLSALAAVATQNDPQARQKELLAKSQTVEGLTADERTELSKSLAGDDETSLAAEVVAPMQSDSLQKSLDVSDYLRDFNEGLEKSLTVIADRMEKSEATNGSFRSALATVLTAQGELIKSLTEEVAALKGAPVAAPKSKGLGAPAQQASMSKSMANTGAEGEQFSKSQIADALVDMAAESSFSKGGHDLSKAVAKLEQTSEINPQLRAEAIEFITSRQSA